MNLPEREMDAGHVKTAAKYFQESFGGIFGFEHATFARTFSRAFVVLSFSV